MTIFRIPSDRVITKEGGAQAPSTSLIRAAGSSKNSPMASAMAITVTRRLNTPTALSPRCSSTHWSNLEGSSSSAMPESSAERIRHR